MLSRTAEKPLYWLARYVEQAEYLARTIDATLRVALRYPPPISARPMNGIGAVDRRRQRQLLRRL